MIQPRDPALPAHVVERVEQFLATTGGRLGAIERLPLQRLVADYCEKYVALDVEGRPAAFIAVSPASHPQSVREAVDASRSIRAALGATLGAAVLTPWFVGDIAGQSCSITAYCTPMSANRWRNRWQRLTLGPGMLAWLADLTRHSAAEVVAPDERVRAPLQALASTAAVDDATRRAAGAALEAFEQGRWRPRSVVAHNDLWWGNFVQRPRGDAVQPPFRVIDWAGGSTAGMPFYDLVRLCLSLNPGRRRVRRELHAHAALLGCEPAHSLHYLCVALGDLACNLGEWPAEQLAATARSCLATAQGALD
jgi:hypothetical protein